MKKLFLILLIAACQSEYDTFKDMKHPVVITDIDSSSKARPVVTLVDADGKKKEVISIEIAFSKNVGDTIK